MRPEGGSRGERVGRDREERQGEGGTRHSVIRGFHIAILTSRRYDVIQT